MVQKLRMGKEKRQVQVPTRISYPSVIDAEQKEESLRISVAPPLVTVASNCNEVWQYVQFTLEHQGRQERRMLVDLKQFIFDQGIEGTTFLNLSEVKLLRAGLRPLGWREALVSVVERAKKDREKRFKDENRDNLYALCIIFGWLNT
jgi:hypothetical protein